MRVEVAAQAGRGTAKSGNAAGIYPLQIAAGAGQGMVPPDRGKWRLWLEVAAGAVQGTATEGGRATPGILRVGGRNVVHLS